MNSKRRDLIGLVAALILVSTLAAAEDGAKAASKSSDLETSAPTHIFRTTASSQKLQTAVAKDLRKAKVDDASVRTASSEELDGMELTLTQYQAAFHNLSLPQIRQVWPNLDRHRETAFKDVFSFLRSASATPKLGLECAPPTVTGDSAKTECRETLAYIDAKGKSKDVKPAKVSISLKKQSDSWVVDTMKGIGEAN